MSPTCISVVVPVYNEDRNIEACLRGLYEALRPYEHEILVCYDFEEDTTLGAIAAMEDPPPTLRLVRNDLGRGAANALRAGFQAARGDVVVTTMADLSDPPDAIPRLAARMRSLGAAVVSGSRYMKGGSQTGGPFVKRCMSQAASLSLRWLAGIGTHDATTNFRAYSREWLARTRIESRDAFDIALELTVKAHLEGERVAEVPSSWVDRVFGESRFKVLHWMPKYLRWYWRACAEPLVVWTAFAAMLVTALLAGGWTPQPSGADTVIVLLQGAVALLCVLAVRAMRGRMRASDALLPVLWLHPWHPRTFHGGWGWTDLAATALGTAGLMVSTVEPGRVRAALRHWSRHLRQILRPGHLGLLLVAALVWLTHLQPPDLAVELGLDPSWRRAYSHFWLHGWQAGVDYVFTYGPLGFLEFGAYVPGVYWEEVVAWEILAKAGFAVVLVAATLLMPNPVDKALYLLALVVGGMAPDAYHFLAILVLAAFLIRRPDVPFGWLAAGFLGLALLAALKFTALVLAFACVAAIALAAGLRRTWWRAAGVLGLWTLVFFLVWGIAGRQMPWNFVAYLRGALPIASGYNEAMSLPPEWSILRGGFHVGVLALAAIVLLALRRPWNAGRVLYAGLLAAGFWLAFKSAFVRHGGSVTYFGFAAPAVLLAQWPTGVVPAPRLGRLLDLALAAARYGCVIAVVLHHPTVRPDRSPALLVGQWATLVPERVQKVRDLPDRKDWLDGVYHRLREHFDLPRIRERVGDQPVDLVTVDVEHLLFNGLRWTPRPVFQSYSAYTPRLLRRNARRFEGEDALPFVLVRLGVIDGQLATQQDALVFRRLLADYTPVLKEKGFLLMERRPAASRPPSPERAVLLDREVRFGETIELPPNDGEGRVLALDIRPTLLGRLRNFLLSTPGLHVELETDLNVHTRRIVPAIVREGIVLDPLILGDPDLPVWLAGERLPPVRRLRVLASKHAACFQPVIRLRLERAEDLVPPVLEERLRQELLYPMFKVPPALVLAANPTGRLWLEDPPGTEALLVHAPSQIAFDVAPGPHRVRALYGILPSSWKEGWTDGVTFSVLEKEGDAPPQVLFERHLNPVEVDGDRPPQVLEMDHTFLRPARLLLRTTSDNVERDWAWWAEVDVRPLGGAAEQRGG